VCSDALDVSASVLRVAEQLHAAVGVTGHGAVVEGIHAEGPVVATLGGLPESDAAMAPEQFCELLDLLGPALRVMTIAPSIDAREGYPRIKALLARGVKPALGHDKRATVADCVGALRLAPAGSPLHVTHALNVMCFHHRECGLANVALAPRFPATDAYAGAAPPTVEVIGDLAHVDPLALQLLVGSKAAAAPRGEELHCPAPGAACFITDGIAEPVLGQRLEYDGRWGEVVEKGGRRQVVLTQPESMAGTLIGSCIMMLDALRAGVDVLGLSLPAAVDMCAGAPARIAGLAHVGTLEAGKRADLALFEGEQPLPPSAGAAAAGGRTASAIPQLRQTIVAGAVVFDRDQDHGQ